MAIHPIPASRDEWLKLRAPYVGASEVSSLLGVMGYEKQMSGYALWHVKAGKIKAPDFDDERMEAGRHMEPGIATWACEREGWTQLPGVFATDDECPGSSATLDRVVMPSTEDVADGFVGPGSLECKNVDRAMYYEKWLGDRPPANILIQLQDQLACTGYLWGAVAAVVGGNELYLWRYMRHVGLITQIRTAVTEFWASIKAGTPPPIDHYESTAYALKQLHPRLTNSNPVDMRNDNVLPGIWDRYTELSAEAKGIEGELSKIKNDIRKVLEGNSVLLLADGRKISRSISDDLPARMVGPKKGADTLHFTRPKQKGKAA